MDVATLTQACESTERVVAGWDVRADRATARQTITDDGRAPRIGPAVALAPDAPVGDQLVAFLGRRP